MENISVKELEKRMGEDVESDILLDVRDEEQHKMASIPAARNIPSDSLEGAVDELKKYKTVYVACNTGNTSSKAYELLKKRGVHVVNVEGGLSAWKEAGFSLKKKG